VAQTATGESNFAPASEVYDGSEKHQYCTECVIALKDGATKAAVEARLSDPKFGDSMVVVAAPAADGKSSLCKVHIHSDEPQAVFTVLTDEFSATKIPLKEKSDDMRRQVADSKKRCRLAPCRRCFHLPISSG
jgi:dihydroxyacetone kinase-like predicted kinase